MFANEVWICIYVHGPQSEIDRLKELCIVPIVRDRWTGSTLTIDFKQIISMAEGGEKPFGEGGFVCEPHNFHESAQKEVGSYFFKFDVPNTFPTPVLERLAQLFPSLAFNCECIASMDEFMGYGWFNGPKGGEAFDYYDVPEGYWDEGGGFKRDAMAELRHQLRVTRVKCGAQKASENGYDKPDLAWMI